MTTTASTLRRHPLLYDVVQKLRRILVASAKGFSIGAGLKGGLSLFAILARLTRKKPQRIEYYYACLLKRISLLTLHFAREMAKSNSLKKGPLDKVQEEAESSVCSKTQDAKPQRVGTLPNYGFSFRCGERAERRKQFYTKLEEKICAKELERSNMQAKPSLYVAFARVM